MEVSKALQPYRSVHRENNKKESSFCSPSSRSGFNHRLRTFTATKWFAKPDIISPLECARHGWINVGMDMIQCNICNEKLSFEYSGLNFDETEAAAKNFAKYLDIGHTVTCSWRNCESPSSFLKLPQEHGLQGLKHEHSYRYKSLIRIYNKYQFHFQQSQQSQLNNYNDDNEDDQEDFLNDFKKSLIKYQPLLINDSITSSLAFSSLDLSKLGGESKQSQQQVEGSQPDVNEGQAEAQVEEEVEVKESFLLTDSNIETQQGLCAVFAMYGWRAEVSNADNNENQSSSSLSASSTSTNVSSPEKSSEKTTISSSSSSSVNLCCDLCGQHMPLSNMKKQNHGKDEEEKESDNSRQMKRLKTSSSLSSSSSSPSSSSSHDQLNIISPSLSHRWFCPWVRGYHGSIAGWEQCMHALQNDKPHSKPNSLNSRPEVSLSVKSAMDMLRRI